MSPQEYIARRAKPLLEEANRNQRIAARHLAAAAKRDRYLRDALTEPLIGNACTDAIERIAAKTN